ncbi:MAG: deoxyribonuclease IV [Gammaproteobacteria bacterium]|nr:deoxyribonuclease IV [Gammaproteobacteria bacterium]
MKYIGAHVSSAEGVFNAPLRAKEIGAKAFALFIKNQRQWFAKANTPAEIAKFKENLAISGIAPEYVLPHDSYLINLGHPEAEKRKRSTAALLDEAQRAEKLGLKLLNFHPGSHLKQISEAACLDNIAAAMNEVLAKTETITLVIENTAGQGGNVGYKFEHLADLIDKTVVKERVGACIDTCHMFAAGYDIRTKIAYTQTWQEFANIVGFEYLKAMHLNDAKSEFASRVDRHHSIGLGNIGLDAFKFIMQDKRMDEIPLILETIDSALWPEEIKLLYDFIEE